MLRGIVTSSVVRRHPRVSRTICRTTVSRAVPSRPHRRDHLSDSREPQDRSARPGSSCFRRPKGHAAQQRPWLDTGHYGDELSLSRTWFGGIMKRGRVSLWVLTIGLVVAGCSSSPTTSGPDASTAQKSISSPATETTSSTGPSEPAASTPTSPPPIPVTTTEVAKPPPETTTSTGPPVVTGTKGSSQNLTLDQAVHSSGWSEKVDTPVGGASQQAIVTDVTCSSDFDPNAMLEYRFSGASGTLTVTFQQSLGSDTSDGIVEAAMFVDGRQSLQQFSFKEKRTFSTPLAGVNAIKLAVRGVSLKDTCPGTSTVLITSISVS